jgi:hypothetical protein
MSSASLETRSSQLPITSIESDPSSLTLTAVGEYPVPIERLLRDIAGGTGGRAARDAALDNLVEVVEGAAGR